MAEIPFGEFAVAADAERRVDVELEVEPETLGCLGLAHGGEHAHERLGSAELVGPGLVSKPVAAGGGCDAESSVAAGSGSGSPDG
jgi:hypothetical protein